MRSFHVPWRAGPRRARAGGLGRMGRVALAVAVVLGLTLVSAAQHAASAATGAPYGGTAAAVPGTVYAANYDTGGQGVAYNVTSANGSANSYRSDGIDLEATADTVNNTGAGADDIGWTTPGQWFNYTVNVATAGTYTVAFRVSSPYGITDALHIDNASGHQPVRLGDDPQHRRLPDLDDGRRERHAAGRAADADRRPGLQRVELPLHDVHPHLRGRRDPAAERRRPVRRDPGPGARHRPGGELRHRRAGRRLQRHRRQRHRQQLPLRRRRPRGQRRHVGHQPGRRRATTSAGRPPGSGSSTPSR